MIVVPAIDLRGGRCVRLVQGRADAETVFSDDPVATARRWVAEGARRLHLVDLDGAFAGEPKQPDLIDVHRDLMRQDRRGQREGDGRGRVLPVQFVPGGPRYRCRACSRADAG